MTSLAEGRGLKERESATLCEARYALIDLTIDCLSVCGLPAAAARPKEEDEGRLLQKLTSESRPPPVAN